MANVQHSALTGAELHEPKGAAAAATKKVYVSDGAGSGAWTDLSAYVDSYNPGNVTVATGDKVLIQDISASDALKSVTAQSIADLNSAAQIKTGTYTGDGATSQAITGVGFAPKYVRIWARFTSENSTGAQMVETTDTMVDDNASGYAYSVFSTTLNAANVGGYTNRIIALGADGFTVDDAALDAHPNKNAQVYNYMAIG
jgi:hypothetical protein